MIKKGLILAGGEGTRLYPLTRVVSKQLLPVHDKPMIYYPLSTLLLAGITDILIITRPDEVALFQKLLGDGSQWGIRISFTVQDRPRGIADAFIVGEAFIAGDPVCLILGDNIFYRDGLETALRQAAGRDTGATVFAKYVDDPERYGIAEFDADRNVISLEEKPDHPKSNYAVTGLYFYDRQVCDIAKSIEPSARGELEITDVNRVYLEQGTLRAEILDQDVAWLDTGTHDALREAGNFVASVEETSGARIACIEEIVYRQGLIMADALRALAHPLRKTDYGAHLERLADAG